MREWEKIYQERLMSADQALKMVKSGQRLLTGHNSSEPKVLLDALCRRAGELKNVSLWQGLNISEGEYAKPEYAGHIYVDSIFLGPSTRDAINEQRGQFTPMHLSLIDRCLREGQVKLDGFLTTVTPPNEEGFCNFGVSGDYAIHSPDYCDYIIAAVNPHMPWTCSEGQLNQIPVARVAAFVETDLPIPTIGKIDDNDPITEQIGKNIAGLIEDGSTLQMGQGKVPNAILRFLGGKKDLGIHTEVFSDNLLPLIEQGVITGAKKRIDVGKIVTTFIQGTKALYRYADHNELIKVMPGCYTNSPGIIAQNDRVVAINAALEIDMMGQVAAESIGPRQISGIGGQLDFLRGAAYSKGGKPILALPSTAQNGKVSRIVATLTPGAPITTPRADIFWVVTEYGAVNLFGKSIQERAKALLNLAHPDFRAELAKDFAIYLRSMGRR
ncbi:MAG: 4-hydroxybutyrate CoA-transferase [Peptococcaceae bacterium]|jgi:4-hydroxybutyrate CoA-transferase|nr:4-hydroxybutyrate CoA-transferase [Peptococcaceae bacterium]